jgi:hypothetical protein
MRLEKKVMYGDKEWTLATINNKTARSFSMFTGENGAKLTNRESNERLTVASLIAGGHTQEEAQELVDNIPVFLDSAWTEFLGAMLEVNGLKLTTPGETQAAASPAAEE